VSAPPPSVTPISPGEMQLLLSRAGLALNPGQIADLVLAWRQVAGLITMLPHDRPLADDMALAFRLAPPAGGGAEDGAQAKPQAGQKRAVGPVRQPAKPKAKAKVKAAPVKKRAAKRPVAKSSVRKKARRKK
jgi:hypothetical protein